MTERRRDLWSALLLVVLATLLFSDVLFLGNNFYLRDLFQYHFPLKRIVRDTIAAGEFPWWERRIAGGQPMAANPAYEIFYPPQWLIFVGPFAFGFALHILVHVYLALLGMYAFLRSIPLRFEAALFGSISFGLSGFLLGSSTNLPTFFVWSWAGVVGWAVLRTVRGGKIGAAAIAIAMPLLVGEPMALAQMLLLIAAGTLWIDRRAIGRVAAAVVIGAALAAVQILPAIDHARDSSRSRGFRYDVVTDYSMPAVRPLELLDAHLFGILTPEAHAWWGAHVFRRGAPYLPSIYCGLAVVILGIAGMVTRQRGTALVLAICLVSYGLAIGDRTPIFRWLYDAGLRSIRYPEKFAATALIVLIVFAAFLADRLLHGDVRLRRAVIVTGGVTAAVLFGAAALCSGARFVELWQLPARAAALAPAQRQALIAAAFLAAFWTVIAWRIGPRSWSWLALGLLLFDLAPFASEAMPRMPREFFTPPPEASSLRGAVFHRGEWTQQQLASQYASLSPGWTARNGLRPYSAAAWGVPSVLEADFDETALLPTHDLLDAMIRLGNSGAPQWSERFAALANAGTIIDYRPLGEAIGEARGNPARLQPIVIIHLPTHGTYYFPHTPDARVTAVHETSSTAAIDVETKTQSFLIATVTRHKDWKATIDGRPAQLLPANLAYQQLEVPPGRHHIEMRYRNPLVIWGAAISILALIAITAPIPPLLRPRSGS